MIPILAVLACGVSLYGAYLGANIQGIVSWDLFWTQVFDTLAFSDVIPAILKTFFFGFFIGIIGCYKGFNSEKGTEGVGQSANSAVVISSLLVFIIDLIAVQITDVLGLT
jgi:phospholipid/cholesterol/gamma-HCH transport system permease protein